MRARSSAMQMPDTHQQSPDGAQQTTKPLKPHQRVDAALQTQEVLDDEQQEQLIHDFEEMQLATARTNRAIFGVGAALLAAFFGWQAYAQLLHPWGQRITGELRGAGADGGAMFLALSVEAVAMAACSAALLQGMPAKGVRERGCLPAGLRQQVLLWSSLVVSLLCCVYWLHVHWGMVAKFGRKLGARWDLLWVPLAPPVYNLVSLWVVSSLSATGKEVVSLRQLRYTHKSA